MNWPDYGQICGRSPSAARVAIRRKGPFRVMPFCYDEWSAGTCAVLGLQKILNVFSQYVSGFFEPAASHPPQFLPRYEGLLGQAGSDSKGPAPVIPDCR